MAREVGGLEADEIGSEHALEQLGADGKTSEDLRGREGDVHEEADASIREGRTNHVRDEHQMVVVHPDCATLERAGS